VNFILSNATSAMKVANAIDHLRDAGVSDVRLSKIDVAGNSYSKLVIGTSA